MTDTNLENPIYHYGKDKPTGRMIHEVQRIPQSSSVIDSRTLVPCNIGPFAHLRLIYVDNLDRESLLLSGRSLSIIGELISLREY